jgi:hypothetical protein
VGPASAWGEGAGRVAGAAWPGRVGWASWSDRVGPVWVGPFFFFFVYFFYFSLLIDYAFEHSKIVGKIQIKYRWKPCEKVFTMRPLLKQNKIIYESQNWHTCLCGYIAILGFGVLKRI